MSEINGCSVGHKPEGKWEFDQAVTDVFDDMLRRSIPQYEVMRDLCFRIGSGFVKPKTAVIDLGCSRGEALRPFVDKFGAQNRFVGIEVSKPMLESARGTYKGYIDCGVVSIQDVDLRRTYPKDLASLTLCVLTLQFTPIEYRQKILTRMFEQTAPGGAAIIVEKIMGESSAQDDLLISHYYAGKAENGYSEDDVARKRMSLEGVLVPLTGGMNEQLFKEAGFRVQRFWQYLNFAGWICTRV